MFEFRIRIVLLELFEVLYGKINENAYRVAIYGMVFLFWAMFSLNIIIQLNTLTDVLNS